VCLVRIPHIFYTHCTHTHTYIYIYTQGFLTENADGYPSIFKARVDASKCEEIIKTHNIIKATLLVFKNGNEKTRFTGFLEKKLQRIFDENRSY